MKTNFKKIWKINFEKKKIENKFCKIIWNEIFQKKRRKFGEKMGKSFGIFFNFQKKLEKNVRKNFEKKLRKKFLENQF